MAAKINIDSTVSNALDDVNTHARNAIALKEDILSQQEAMLNTQWQGAAAGRFRTEAMKFNSELTDVLTRFTHYIEQANENVRKSHSQDNS
jgi:uncharacterized protein YukE